MRTTYRPDAMRLYATDMDDPKPATVETTPAAFLRDNGGDRAIVKAIRTAWMNREDRPGRRFAAVIPGGGSTPRVFVSISRFDGY